MADGPGSPESGDQSPRSSVREQDRCLPIANISRIMKKALPANGKIAKDAKETLQECVSEFISFVTSEASDKCQKEKRKTVNGDDLLWAMATLGFEDYIDPLKVYLQRFREIEGDAKGAVKGGDGSAKRDGLGVEFGQNIQARAIMRTMGFVDSAGVPFDLWMHKRKKEAEFLNETHCFIKEKGGVGHNILTKWVNNRVCSCAYWVKWLVCQDEFHCICLRGCLFSRSFGEGQNFRNNCSSGTVEIDGPRIFLYGLQEDGCGVQSAFLQEDQDSRFYVKSKS